jgi:methyl-accepting chemotaxis protein
MLLKECQRGGWIKIGYANPQGQNMTTLSDTPIDASDRDFFKTALQGDCAVSDPIVSRLDNSLIVNFAVPVKANGKVVAVLLGSRDGNELSNIISDIKYKTTGKAFMVNTKGITIAHTNKDLVVQMDNIVENAKKDQSLSELAGIITKMANKEKDLGIYSYKGVRKVVAYQPVEGMNWSIGISVDYDDIYGELITANRQLPVLVIIFVLLGIGIGILFTHRVINPINKITRQGQVDFIMSGLNNKSIDPSLSLSKPEIYYGELTKDHVIVGAKE